MPSIDRRHPDRRVRSIRGFVLVSVLISPWLMSPIQAEEAPAVSPLELTTLGVVRAAVAGNAQAIVARLEEQRALRVAESESGLYEPQLVATVDYSDRLRLRSEEELNPFMGTIYEAFGNDAETADPVYKEQIAQVAAGVEGLLPSGAEWRALLSASERDLNLFSDDKGREHRGSMTIEVRQPLLRGLGRDIVESDLKVARIGADAAKYEYEAELNDRVAEALVAYWSLYRAVHVRDIQEEALANATSLREDISARQRLGMVQAAELLEADVNLATRRADLARANQSVNEALANLENALNVTGLSKENEAVDLLTAPNPSKLLNQTLQERLTTALANSPNLEALRLRKSQENQRLKKLNNERKPNLDFVGVYRSDSLTYDDRNQALDKTFSTDYPDWSVGLEFNMPLQGNIRARGAAAAQQVRVSQSHTELAAAEKSLENGVVARWQQLLQTHDEFEQIDQAYELGARLVEIDQRRYELGSLRLSELLDREDDDISNRRRRVEGLVRLEIARAALLRAEGRLLHHYGVEVR